MTALQGIGLPLPNHYASPCRNPFPLVATETPASTVVWLAWLRPVAGTAAGLSLISIRKPVDHRVGTWQRAAGSRSPTPLAALFARKPTRRKCCNAALHACERCPNLATVVRREYSKLSCQPLTCAGCQRGPRCGVAVPDTRSMILQGQSDVLFTKLSLHFRRDRSHRPVRPSWRSADE